MYGAPAMPRKVLDQPEPHRLLLRELVAQRIKQVEFQVAFELFFGVARLVSRDEVARTPKAQAKQLSTLSGRDSARKEHVPCQGVQTGW